MRLCSEQIGRSWNRVSQALGVGCLQEHDSPLLCCRR
ncbi:unnamed protein product [Musa acuminata subsp. burmannicoides]